MRRLRGGLPPAHRAHAGARVPAAVRPALRHRRPEPAASTKGSSASASPHLAERDGHRAVVGAAHAHRHRARHAAPAAPARARRADRVARSRRRAARARRADRDLRPRRHRAADDEPRHERRRAGVRARACSCRTVASSPTARPTTIAARVRARRPRRRVPASRRATTSRRPPNRATTHDRTTQPSTELPTDDRAREVVAAHARDRAPARVRARAQPAPAVRRVAVAARRRVLFGSLAAFVGTNGAIAARRRPSGYLLAGIVLWHVIYQSQIAMSTGLPRGDVDPQPLNLMVTPVREVEYVGGRRAVRHGQARRSASA